MFSVIKKKSFCEENLFFEYLIYPPPRRNNISIHWIVFLVFKCFKLNLLWFLWSKHQTVRSTRGRYLFGLEGICLTFLSLMLKLLGVSVWRRFIFKSGLIPKPWKTERKTKLDNMKLKIIPTIDALMEARRIWKKYRVNLRSEEELRLSRLQHRWNMLEYFEGSLII